MLSFNSWGASCLTGLWSPHLSKQRGAKGEREREEGRKQKRMEGGKEGGREAFLLHLLFLFRPPRSWPRTAGPVQDSRSPGPPGSPCSPRLRRSRTAERKQHAATHLGEISEACSCEHEPAASLLDFVETRLRVFFQNSDNTLPQKQTQLQGMMVKSTESTDRLVMIPGR